MKPDMHVDPRGRRLRPTQEEIDTWAAREHQRRTAWLAGPSEEEKLAWAKRPRWRSALGLEADRAPTREDIDLWAAREQKRRAAWAAGPSEAETAEWARAHAARAGDDPPSPAETDAEGWAARERQRRQAWLRGPTEDEKHAWAERQTRGLLEELAHLPFLDDALRLGGFEGDVLAAANDALRDAELVGKGALYVLSRAPLGLWSYLVRAGRAFERESGGPSPRRRVRY